MYDLSPSRHGWVAPGQSVRARGDAAFAAALGVPVEPLRGESRLRTAFGSSGWELGGVPGPERLHAVGGRAAVSLQEAGYGEFGYHEFGYGEVGDGEVENCEPITCCLSAKPPGLTSAPPWGTARPRVVRWSRRSLFGTGFRRVLSREAERVRARRYRTR
ncbi:MAG: hypothetical protein ACXW61_15370, partial [Gemmatirosa sp.]